MSRGRGGGRGAGTASRAHGSGTTIYSRWDDTQPEFSLDAEEILDELSEYLMEGFELSRALDWMRRGGLEGGGRRFRVMGLDELLSELRRQATDLMSQVNLDHAFDELRERFAAILEREHQSVRDQWGVESGRWQEFKRREDSLPDRLSEALDRFRDYEWTDPEAESEYRELLEQLDDMRDLESFHARNRPALRGDQSLDFQQAVELMRQVEAMGQLVRDLLQGNLQELSLDDLREFLGDDAAQSIVLLRGLEDTLERAGYLRRGAAGPELTPRAIRRLGELALDSIYASLRRARHGGHETRHRGVGVISTEATRPYVFGEPAQIDAMGTLRNALRRRAAEPAAAGAPLSIGPEDLEVFDTDLNTETTTVLLLDMSRSMQRAGRWPAAKRVAIAMDALVRTRYPRDHFFTVGFYTRARQLQPRELPELVWSMDDPFTNLQDGLRVAQRLIDRHPSPNRQILVITDGQPTAFFHGEELHVELPPVRGGVSPDAVAATLHEARRVTRKSITINTFMLNDAPELVGFVEVMTRINRGRAFYTTPDTIGRYVMVDYLAATRRRIA